MTPPLYENNPELLKEYLDSASEILRHLEQELVLLEKEPGSGGERAATIFRGLHNLKGDSSLIGFKWVASFIHDVETAFNEVRKGSRKADRETTDLLLECIDTLKLLIADAAKGGDGSAVDLYWMRYDLAAYHL